MLSTTFLDDLVRPEERVAFATAAIDAGARFDIRVDLLKSTPLGWACRWSREELVPLSSNGVLIQ